MWGLSRASLYAVHRWLGLNCGAVLFVICFSGTIATLGQELDWLIDPKLRVGGDGPPLPIAEIADRVAADHADWSVISITAAEPGFAYPLDIERSDGKRERLLVHPWTAEIIGPTSTHRARMLFRVFHKQFYLFPTQAFHGTYLVGLYAFVLLFSGITGLCCYKRFWTKLFVLRRGVFWRDAHRLLGVWGAALLFLWGLTGIWYFAARFRPSNEAAASSNPSGLTPERRQSLGDAYRLRSAAELLSAVERERPDVVPVHLILPNRPGSPLILYGRSRSVLSGNSAYLVRVDSHDGTILEATPAVPQSIVEALDAWVDPLHFGTFGGLTTKIVWFVFGLAVSALIPIGAVIWVQRTSQKPAARQNSEQNAPANSTGPARRSRFARWTSTLFASAILASAGISTWMNSPPRSTRIPPQTPRISLGRQAIGPWNVELEQLQAAGAEQTVFRAVFPRDALPNFVSAELRWTARDDASPMPGQPLKGSWHFLHAALPRPASPGEQSVALIMKDQAGTEHTASFETRDCADDPAPAKGETFFAPREIGWVFGGFIVLTGIVVALWFRYVG